MNTERELDWAQGQIEGMKSACAELTADRDRLQRENEVLTNKVRELCCDLANDARCFEQNQIDARTVIARLAGYAHDLSDLAHFDGPASLAHFEKRIDALDAERKLHADERDAARAQVKELREVLGIPWPDDPTRTPEFLRRRNEALAATAQKEEGDADSRR